MQAIITENREKIAELCRSHHVRRLSVFGSAVREDFDPARSDVDLLVDFDTSDDFRYAKNFFALQRALGALLARKVDLVVSETLDNPIIRRRVEAQKRLLYGA